jgi:hypothetical protein
LTSTIDFASGKSLGFGIEKEKRCRKPGSIFKISLLKVSQILFIEQKSAGISHKDEPLTLLIV